MVTSLKIPSLAFLVIYSEAVRDKRRTLWQFSKTVKKDKDRVSLVFNKLKVNKDVYIWDTQAPWPVECSASEGQMHWLEDGRNSGRHDGGWC